MLVVGNEASVQALRVATALRKQSAAKEYRGAPGTRRGPAAVCRFHGYVTSIAQLQEIMIMPGESSIASPGSAPRAP